ncbi:hypothetical protein H4S08_002274 [Coemansia sp. RSA 1365]|nr:hypothetical protein H4S08_002274 [Coemansia sp. RSA 1365]
MAPSKLSPDARRKLAANLQVLRRYDSQIEALIDTTSHVVLYQFQEASQTWANKEVEGALFIFKRLEAPYYGFTIMNRLGLKNHTELLSADMSFQTSDQIVIYTSKSSNGIVGIWIYEEADRSRIPEQLSLCCRNAKSGSLGQGLQYLYPRDSEEEREFQLMYPRSRSNSRREGVANHAGPNGHGFAGGHVRQKRPGKAEQNGKVDGNSNAGVDLLSKLQAIGLDPTHGGGSSGSSQAAVGDSALQADPAIILARKSVNPHEMILGPESGAHRQNSVGSGSNEPPFKSPLPMPSVDGATDGGGISNSNLGAQAVSYEVQQHQQQPVSPGLRPVPSPFPPSTIATPLPAQGPPRGGAGVVNMQQVPPFWYSQTGMQATDRAAHASPAPVSYGGIMSGMLGFPHMASGHTPQPALQASSHPVAAETGGPNVAHNLAEQLVQLVRQRMNSVNQGAAALPQQQQMPVPGATDSAVKLQREYCREWLLRVIQADDELVDAFARRFPPPIVSQPQQP